MYHDCRRARDCGKNCKIVLNMTSSILTIAVWVAMFGYSRESSPCSLTLTAKSALVELGSSANLTCQVCSSNVATNFNHNATYIADYALGQLTVANTSLYLLAYDNGTLVSTLTILNFTYSSSGNYTCFIPSTTSLSWIVLTAQTNQGSTPVDTGFSPGILVGVICGGCLLGLVATGVLTWRSKGHRRTAVELQKSAVELRQLALS